MSTSPTQIRKTVAEGSVRVSVKWGLVLLSGAVIAAQAMTLGELRGEAFIGRALDLSLPFQSAEGEVLTDGCVRADVYYGESRQSAPRVSIQAGQLRLRLSEPVNEPVVRVQVRTFCGTSQIRNYVLLADLPPDFSASVAVNMPPMAALVPPAPSSADFAAASVVLPQRATTRAKPRVSAPRKLSSSIGKNKNIVKKAKAKEASTKRPGERKAASPQQAKSVLKLDPLEILSDRMDNLEPNMPFLPAEDALLQSRQIATLQAEVKSMRELTVKNDSAVQALRSQLEKAQSQQVFTTLLYGLVALLLIGVVGLAWLWQRQKKLTVAARFWWEHSSDEDLTAFSQPESATASPRDAGAPVSAYPTAVSPTKAAGDRATLAPQRLATPELATIQPEPPPDLTIAPVAIHSESVQDMRQQADFFISLGQDHRAIQILSQHIASSELPNPLICLDLLGRYRHANQVAQFNLLRDVCRQHFNVHLPDLDNFQHEGQDLTCYPQVLTSLTRLWPGEQALVFMDRCIFLKAANQTPAPFDLAAFRDLLSLHALAEELALPKTPS